METEDYERDFLRDRIIMQEEKRMRMEAEWLEAEHYAEQLPAKIEILIEKNKQEQSTKN